MSLAYAPAARLLERFLTERLVTRIWNREPAAWGAVPGSPDERSITTRLGWLDVAKTMASHLPRVTELSKQATSERIEAVYLLGMGGSSLCAEVLRTVFGIKSGYPELYVLDTTDEHTIRNAADRLDPARTLFLVSSKSGGTVEVASLERFFWSKITDAQGNNAGRHFVAITDPYTALQGLAQSKQ